MSIFRTPPQIVRPGKSDTIIIQTNLAMYEITVRQRDGSGTEYEAIIIRPTAGTKQFATSPTTSMIYKEK